MRKKRLSEIATQALIADRLAGANIASLMSKYDVTRDTVKQLTRHVPEPESGWSRKPKTTKLKEAQRGEILALIPEMSLREIAYKFGVTYRTLTLFLKESKPTTGWGKRTKRKGSFTANDIMIARSMRLQGATLQSIADTFHVSAQSAHRMVKGVIPEEVVWKKGHKLSKEQREDAIRRRLRGEPLSAIAALYNVTSQNIYQVTKRFKPPGGWPGIQN